ncbi:MAG: deoxyribodipyrimidine photo-lyase [Lentimonas sp.]
MINQENKSIFWHRRDLRIDDNNGLFQALNHSEKVFPVFIFDTNILSKLLKTDRRAEMIYSEIIRLKEEYEELGSSLIIRHGKPEEILPQLIRECGADSIYANEDYEPYAIGRDRAIEKKILPTTLSLFKDHVIFAKDEVMKNDGLPYTIFTPYKNKWKATLTEEDIAQFDCVSLAAKLAKITGNEELEFINLGFERSESLLLQPRIVRTSILKNYHNTRDIPSMKGTSQLSFHLRFGTLSIRKLAQIAQNTNEKYLDELIWRDFYQMILFHFPESENHSFKKKYEGIKWINNESDFKAWREGKTGYPIVDAGMRQLNQTGWMHNRVRMIVASFLCKHLLIDWKWGETYFASQLIDYDCASNVGGWQWAAGTGCDAQPYFRVFNPYTQQQKFDKEFDYIKRWIPEFDTDEYPEAIVEHAFARKRAIACYKTHLESLS